MKILYLTQTFPYPLENGGHIKTYQTIRLLGQSNEVYLCCFSPQKLPESSIKKIKSFCKKIYCLESPYVVSDFRKIKSFIFRALFSLNPFIAFRYEDKRMKRITQKLIKKEKFDAIYIGSMNLATYLPQKKQSLWVLEEHNVESEMWWEIGKREKWNKFKLFCLLETLKLMLFERKVLPKFDRILAISEVDKQKMVSLGVPESRISFLPTACEVNNKFSFKNKGKLIFFVGTLFWWPNKEGIEWFYRKVFPLVKKKIPKVKLLIVGIGGEPDFTQLVETDKSAIMVGYQPDLDKFWYQAGIFIAPIRVGSGIRIKILTALSRGIPVVSTSKGAEGIVDKTGHGVFLADNPDDFARQVIALLTDQKLAEEASAQAREFIKKEYCATKAKKILSQIYDQ